MNRLQIDVGFIGMLGLFSQFHPIRLKTGLHFRQFQFQEMGLGIMLQHAVGAMGTVPHFGCGRVYRRS